MLAAALLCLVGALGAAAQSGTAGEGGLPDCFDGSGFEVRSSGYSKGDDAPTALCLLVGNNATGQWDRVLFDVEVDDFTLFELTDAAAGNTRWIFDSPPNGGADVRLQVGTTVSDFRNVQWTVETIDYAAAFLTAVVVMEDGSIEDIEWDDGCDGCSGARCHRSGDENGGTCGITRVDCDTGDLSCNPKVYVAWLGTDSDGFYATSAGKTWSRFRQFSVNEIYSNAARTSSENAPSI